MTSQPRPVWLTREQRDRLALHGWRRESDAWDAAPADAAEAVRLAIGYGIADGLNSSHIAPRVMGALGCPHTEQA